MDEQIGSITFLSGIFFIDVPITVTIKNQLSEFSEQCKLKFVRWHSSIIFT